MTILNEWKTRSALLLLSAVTAVATQAQTFTKLADFDSSNGEEPIYVSLVQSVDGNLYGTTAWGGGGGYYECAYDYPGCGTVFRITPAGALSRVYSFCPQSDCAGVVPYAGLIQAVDGDLYGTTSSDSVFKMSLEGKVTIIYAFCRENGCADGDEPTAPLVQGRDGDFYGTTYGGGSVSCPPYTDGCGTVFKITTDGVLTTLHSFSGGDGGSPVAGLVQATDGNLYGTAVVGGDSSCNAPPYHGCGTIFKITPSGSLVTIHNFEGNDGAYPYGGLVQGSDGNLYGTTYSGGSGSCLQGCGTVFKLSQSGTLTTIHDFSGDGCAPSGTLIQATDGNLYGTTQQEGFICPHQGSGTIFKIAPGGAFTTLHTFDGSDGASPYAGLIQSTDGNFYGATGGGGSVGDGTIYRLSVGLGPFVSLLRSAARIGQMFGIIGQGFKGTTSVSVNGTPANFTVISETLIKATVPPGATTGYVTVTTPTGVLTSNVQFHVIP
jgi:uncharacterized repeat protein (TIGR03803 family)